MILDRPVVLSIGDALRILHSAQDRDNAEYFQHMYCIRIKIKIKFRPLYYYYFLKYRAQIHLKSLAPLFTIIITFGVSTALVFWPYNVISVLLKYYASYQDNLS